MNRLKDALADLKGGDKDRVVEEKVDADSDESHPVHPLNTNGQSIRLTTVVSQEFDPMDSKLEKTIYEDEYAAPIVEDDSPYPEVRAAVPSVDDPTIPQNTIRMWVIGIILTTIGCALNLLFSLHRPQAQLSTYVTSILAWPIGVAWARFLPNVKIFGMELNPGPFNLKEHALITIMGNVSFGAGGAAYATDILLAQNVFYKQDFGWGFDLVAIWSTQCIGFALAGIMRKILIYPSSMIYPLQLITATFLTNMHINKNVPANGWSISRMAFFSVVFCCSFVWYFFPGVIFTGLSYFAWITWIKPNNVIVNQIFGASTGLGMFPNCFSLDWNQIAAYVGSPLIPPAPVLFTILFSVVLIFWIIVPAIHYSNTWYAQYLPISSSGSFDNTQQEYDVLRIVTKNLTFDKKAYEEYSPLFLSTTFAISYGLSFASMTATIVHTILFNGKDIIKQIKMEDKPDVHTRLMKENYRDVPAWWFGAVFLVFFGLSIATVRAWDTQMPVWCLIVALLIAIVFLIPVGVIYAITNIAVGLNVLTEFIIGYMLPGKPLAMMFFKTFGYITNNQAVTFVSDMKLGHYMKLSPRLLFSAQFISTIWGSLVQICVLRWAYGSIDNLCLSDQKNNYTCPNGGVFFNASIIWGVIGPQRQFSHGQIYYGLLFFFIIGAVLPLINWLILKKWPKSFVKHINWPVFFSATGYIPPATPYNFASYCVVGITFNYFIKKRFFHWWSKYNYSLSAGLDIGLAWSLLIVFLCLYLTNAKFPSWWGNSVVNGTKDTKNWAYRTTLAPGQTFGPSKW